MDLRPLPNHVVCLSVAIDDTTGAGEARRLVTKMAEELKFSEFDAGRAALVVTEAATNITRHAGRGEILLRRIAMNTSAGIEIIALDNGPGMTNAAECMKDGFSTAGSLGVGLGAISRMSTTYDILSIPGKGTALLSRIEVGPRRSPEPRLECSAVCVPIRNQEVSGDAWAIDETPERSRIFVVDGLGHGLHAFDATQEALRSFHRMSGEGPEASLRGLEKDLRGTRGAVALAVDISWPEREMRYAGIGNIFGMLIPPGGKGSGLVSHHGALGRVTRRFQEFRHPWPQKALLVVHSDGLSSRWDLAAYPGLGQRDPSLIAGVLYRDFHNRNDDVVVLVCRENTARSKQAP